jgi:hypothetical protein
MINSSKVAIAAALCAGALSDLSCAVAAAAAPATAAVQHFGMCDASAAVAVGADHFLVANDEDNILRLYRRDGADAEPRTFDLSTFLKLPGDKKPREADIEGAAQINNRVYWIASHGANSEGKARPERRQLFATDLSSASGEGDVKVTPVGTPYRALLEAMDKDPLLSQYGLPRAAQFAPESDQGLNIEGLAATPEGHLLIGFRNPVPGGKALLIKLQNPDAVLGLAGPAAPAAPKFAAPIELPLGGLGIRSIEYARNLRAYLIVAGPRGKGGKDGAFKLYKWAEGAAPVPLRIDIPSGLRPEALFALADGKTYGLLSDDGDEQIGGADCKDVEPAARRKFRSIIISP